MATRSERSFQIGFRIDPETHERLVRAAAYTHRSVANYARHVLIERLTAPVVAPSSAEIEQALLDGLRPGPVYPISSENMPASDGGK